jgi:hypothetical protein
MYNMQRNRRGRTHFAMLRTYMPDELPRLIKRSRNVGYNAVALATVLGLATLATNGPLGAAGYLIAAIVIYYTTRTVTTLTNTITELTIDAAVDGEIIRDLRREQP